MRNDLRGICFHGVGVPGRDLEPGEDAYWIDADGFRRILDEVMTWPSTSISFDDGNASDVDVALPALVERGLTATFFVLGARLDQPGSLSRADVAGLTAAGMRVGTHGMDHRSWREMSEEDQHREFVEARDMLVDASGAAVTEAACPLGQYDRHVLHLLRRHGYSTVHTSDRRPARLGAWLQPRFSVRQGQTGTSLRAAVSRAEMARHRAVREAVGVVKRLR